MKTYFFLAAALFAACTFSNDLYAQKKKKPTKQELAEQAAAQARKDSLNLIFEKAKAGDGAAQNEVGTWYYNGKNDYAKDYKQAVEWFKKSAKSGNAAGIGNLALCVEKGHGEAADSALASELYKKSIALGNKALLEKQERDAQNKVVFSNMLLGNCYQEGRGVKRDLAKAATYFETAAKKGCVPAMREGGMCYLNSKQPNKAFSLFKMGSAQKDVVCLYYTGHLLHEGNGVAEDWEKGADYMLKAAEAGMHNAEYRMGNYYKEGKGVRKDAKTAAGWYHKALAGYVSNAAWELAEMYRNGVGVDADYDKALNLYAVAIAEDKGLEKKFRQMVDTDPDFRKSQFASYLKGVRLYAIDKQYDEALAEFKVVSKAKHTEADVMTAVIMANKEYKKANAKKAFKSLAKLAETNADAAYYMGHLYENGLGTEKDMSKAITAYADAAKKGSTLAMNYLGDMRYEGRGLDKDMKLAIELYIAAYKEAQLAAVGTKRLANCYEEGLAGLKKDPKMAEQLLKHSHNDTIGHLLQFCNSL